MDYIKIRFEHNLEALGSRLEKTVADMFQAVNPVFICSEHTWKPQMDIYETRKEIIIRAELSGVEKQNIEIEINRRAVKISGNRNETPSGESGTYRLAEIQYGYFERTFYLPAAIDTDNASASQANGLLELRLAKLPFDVTHKIVIDGA
ncbi:MAG: Hsp20/alpha crystallin family protein [Desulfobacterales bacterium]|nr:Hsp20/alpha crystallin family protein [Desulfobacterales bacterium]